MGVILLGFAFETIGILSAGGRGGGGATLKPGPDSCPVCRLGHITLPDLLDHPLPSEVMGLVSPMLFPDLLLGLASRNIWSKRWIS